MIIVEMLAQPFMQRAFAAGLLLAILLGTLGTFVTLRRMSFFGDGIAHSSLAGIAIALLFGWSPLPVAVLWAVAVALFIFWLERSTDLASDSLIGILFTSSMALGVVIMSFTKGYKPELATYLFGSILAIRPSDIVVIASLAIAIGVWLALSFRHLTFMSLAPDAAVIAGVPVKQQTAALYVALAVATVLGVKILGIILISALLILPSTTARLLDLSFRGFIWSTTICAVIMTLTGLTLSYVWDLPSGATVILTGAAMFFLMTIIKRLTCR